MENGIKKLPMLGLGESLSMVFKRLTDFNGRSRRSELWWSYFTIIIAVSIFCVFFATMINLISIVSIVAEFGLLSAVTVRRLHDRGHSGYWVLASLIISLAGFGYMHVSGMMDIMNCINPDPNKITEIMMSPIWSLLGLLSTIVNICIFVFCVLDGKPEDNKYGASPKYVTEVTDADSDIKD